MKRSVVGDVIVGVRWRSGGEVVVPREVRCPDDDVGRVAEANKAGAARLQGSKLEEQIRKGIGKVNSD